MLKASYYELPSNLHSEGFLVVVMWLPETCMLCFLPGERGMWLAWCWIPPYIWKYIKSNKYLQEGKVSILTQQKLEPSILSEYRSITHPLIRFSHSSQFTALYLSKFLSMMTRSPWLARGVTFWIFVVGMASASFCNLQVDQKSTSKHFKICQQ